MRFVSLLIVFAFAAVAFAQSVPTGSTQASTLLQQSLAAQTGGALTEDITLNGTVAFISDAQDESVPITLTALKDGTSQVSFSSATGAHTEEWSVSNGRPTITGVGPNGSVTQPAGGSITMPSAAWFSPALFTALVSNSDYSSSYVGSENKNGTSVQHVRVWPASASAIPEAIMQEQTRSDLYIDPATALPVAATFRVRPYHKPGTKPLSIRASLAAEEVRYSDYRPVQGRTIPFRLQVYLGDTPPMEFMDITISSVSINKGATIAALAGGN